ncbi:WLM-domain-containing protein [Flagelloscypha sp. PMI_526]|nr:WLM-domain-containing protein [Flagelloscypha sp. PMI_526]
MPRIRNLSYPTMSTPSTTFNFSVSFKGTSYPLALTPDTTMKDLQLHLEELTQIPPHLQKLIYKGKKASAQDDLSIRDNGIKNGTKIQMIGTTPTTLSDINAATNEKEKRERIMRARALKAPVKLRNTSSSNSTTLSYRFHTLKPLEHLPSPSSAQAILEKLASDPAILHIMQTHQYSVGLLTELAPHEHPNLLGLNVNRGEQIKLRIRTDKYDGFRNYREIRKVLCHELTHNVWGDHDQNFKALNSRLNREVVEYEKSVSEGTHRLGERLAEAQAHVLGGSAGQSIGLDESAEARRERILQATMARLKLEEEQVENSCGTAGPAAAPSHEA